MIISITAVVVVLAIVESTPLVTYGLATMMRGELDLIMHSYYERTEVGGLVVGKFINATRIAELGGELIHPDMPWVSDAFASYKRKDGYSSGTQLSFRTTHKVRYQEPTLEGQKVDGKDVILRNAKLLLSTGYSPGDSIEFLLQVLYFDTFVRDYQSYCQCNFDILDHTSPDYYFSKTFKAEGLKNTEFGNFFGESINFPVDDNWIADGTDILPMLAKDEGFRNYLIEKKRSVGETSSGIGVRFMDKKHIYSVADMSTVRSKLMKASSIFMERLGITTAIVFYPLMYSYSLITMENSVMNSVLYLLIIGIVAISSSVILAIQRIRAIKSLYTTTIWRILGTSQRSVFVSTLTSTLFLSVLGLLISIPLVALIVGSANSNQQLKEYHVTITVTWECWAVGFGVAFLVPIGVCVAVASKRAILSLGELLRSSVYMHAGRLSVTDNKREIKSQMTISVANIICCFGIMVAVPMALHSKTTRLFTWVFLVLVFMVVAGLVLASALLRDIFSRLILANLFRWMGRAKLQIARGHLIRHRRRNEQMGLNYAMILTVIGVLFTITMFNSDIAHPTRWYYPGDTLFYILTNTFRLRDANNIFKTVSSNYPTIAWSYTLPVLSSYLQNFMPISPLIEMSDAAKNINQKVVFTGVGPTFFDFVYRGEETPPEDIFVYPSLSTSLDPIRLMYTRFGTSKTLLPAYFVEQFGINCQDEHSFASFDIQYSKNNYSHHTLGCAAGVEHIPAFIFSSRSQVEAQDAFMSYDQYLSLLSNVEENFSSLLLYRNIHFIDRASPKDTTSVNSALSIATTNTVFSTIDKSRQSKTVQQNALVFEYLMFLVEVMVLSLCAVTISTTVASNVIDEKDSIVALRCIGLNRQSISLIFMAETTSVLLSSVLVGSGCCILVSVLISLHFALVLDVSTYLYLPWTTLILPIILAVGISAVVVSAILRMHLPLTVIDGSSRYKEN